MQNPGELFLLSLIAWGLAHAVCESSQRMIDVQFRIIATAKLLGSLTAAVTALFLFGDRFQGAFEIAIVALLTGAGSAMIWYFVIAIGVYLWIYVVTAPFRLLARVKSGWRRRLASRRSAKTSSEKQSQQDLNRQQEERAKHGVEQARRNQQQLRDQARFACQMHYDRIAGSIRDQFPPDRLQEYFERYLPDTVSAAEVETRAEQLRALLDEFDAGGSRMKRRTTLGTIRLEFQTRRHEVQIAGLDDETTSAMLASLSREEERTIREFGQS